MMADGQQERSSRQRWHDSLVQTIEEALKRRIESGESLDDEVMDRVGGAIAAAQEETAKFLREKLNEARPQMLQEWQEVQKQARREVRGVWGAALEQFFEAIVVVDELAEAMHADHVEQAAAENDATFSALMGVLARAVQTAHEVHVLLSQGLPAGASARARTLHELAATAFVLGEHGRGSYQLGKRYLAHREIRKASWAEETQRYAEKLDREPFPDAELQAVRERREHLVEEFGEDFNALYGWAAPLIRSNQSNSNPNSIEGLVEAAGLKHHLPDRTAAAQHVHPTSWGDELNIEGGRRTTWWRLTGLADPAAQALVALHQVATGAIVNAPQEPNVYDTTGLHVLQRIVVDAEEAFMEAHPAAEAKAAELTDQAIGAEPQADATDGGDGT